MDSLKLSRSFRVRNTPWTDPCSSYMPMKIVPPFEFKKETMVFKIVHFALSSLKGIL